MKITVLSPHRDDAAFSIGLTIAEWLHTGNKVDVVNCFTRSEYSPYGDLDYVHANDRRSYVTALRHKEDVRWSRKYHHPVALLDLNLRDSPQRLSVAVDRVCETPVREEDAAIPVLRRKFELRSPHALVLPLGIGNHVDHLTARVAMQDGWPEDLPMAYYEDLPYSARPGMIESIEPRVASLPQKLEPVFTVKHAETKASVDRKRVLALCYDSQIDSEVVEQIATFCERYEGRERLWANKAWREAFTTWP